MVGSKVNAYNVYLEGKKLLGIADETTLPDFEAMTSTLAGAGLLGEIDDPTIGAYSATEIEIPFRTLGKTSYNILTGLDSVNLTMMLSTQYIDESNMKTDFIPSRIVIKGKNKGFSGGKAKASEGTGTTFKVEIFYILVEVDGKPKFELDKLNFVYKVNGKDLLAKVRKQIGMA